MNADAFRSNRAAISECRLESYFPCAWPTNGASTGEVVAVQSGNRHDIEVEGEFGLLRVHIENIPSENPKTGRLTAMSIIRAVRDVADPVRIGT